MAGCNNICQLEGSKQLSQLWETAENNSWMQKKWSLIAHRLERKKKSTLTGIYWRYI